MKKIAFLLAFISIVCQTGFAQTTLSPAAVLDKTVALISSAKGVEAAFTLSNSGYTGRGVIKSAGLKYSVTLPDVEVWYNGKDLYTYNKNSGETTIVSPTREEIEESNPLAYVAGAKKNYKVAFSTVKKPGKYVLELIPIAKGDIKRVTLTVNKSNFHPEKIVVEPSKGNPIASDITSFKTGSSFTSADFEYPKTKYPKAEIVDLR